MGRTTFDHVAPRCGAWAVTALVLVGACTSDGEGDGTTGAQASEESGDDLVTTIPVTSVTASATTGSTNGPTDGSATESTATTTDTDSTASGTAESTGSSGTTSTEGSTEPGTGSTSGSSSSSGEPIVDVDWCILQFPAMINAAPMIATTAYARVYVVGVTDQSQFNDLDPSLLAEFGFGADGSDPAVDVWTWVAGTPNAGWDGSMAKGRGDQTNNDEYQGDLVFGAAGDYDYAARFSADGGTSWSYCDLDDLLTGGYTPAQAGAAVIE